MLYLGKLSEVSGLDTVLVSVENWWYSYYLFLLLMSLLIRDVAEMEEVSFWKCDKILPHSVLNVFSTVHHELTIINDQLELLIIYFIHKYYSPPHILSSKCSSSGGNSRVYASYGTALSKSSWWPVDTVLTFSVCRLSTRNSYRVRMHMLRI